MENGIATYVAPRLGLKEAGLVWVPVPKDGVPERLRAVLGPYFCTSRDVAAQYQKSLTVPELGWAGVERAAEDLITEDIARRANEERKAQEEAALLERAREAARTSQPSDLLKPSGSSVGSRWQSVWVESSEARELLNTAALRRNTAEMQEVLDRFAGMAIEPIVERWGDLPTYVDFNPTNTTGELFKGLVEQVATYKKTHEAAQLKAGRRELLVKAKATEVQLRKFDEGRMSDDESHDLADLVVWSNYEFLPLFEELEETDLEHADECSADEESVRFKSKEWTGGLSDEEFLALEQIRSRGLPVEVRQHTGYCKTCDATVTRHGAKVEQWIHGWYFEREFAL